MAAVLVLSAEIRASSRLCRLPPQSMCELMPSRHKNTPSGLPVPQAGGQRTAGAARSTWRWRVLRGRAGTATHPRRAPSSTKGLVRPGHHWSNSRYQCHHSLALIQRAGHGHAPSGAVAQYHQRETRMSQPTKRHQTSATFQAMHPSASRAHWTMNTKVSSSLPSKLRLLNQAPNPSIERTHNGEAQCLAPSRVVPPLCAAHVKR
jgi:hypothetical protein